MNFAELKAIAEANAIAETTAELPRLYWRNGSKQVKTHGFFYIKADDLNGPPSAEEGWAEKAVYDDERGFVNERGAFIACLGYRQQAFLTDETSAAYPIKVWLPRYEKGAKFYTEMLCWIGGIDEMVSLNMTGMAGRAMTGKGGALYQHQKTVQEIGKAVGARFNPWAFWMDVSSAMDTKGNPIYTDTGYKSFVTLPTLYESHRELGMEAMIAAQFVGPDVYADLTSAQQTYKANEWFDQRRGNVAADEQPDASYHPAAAADPDSDNGLF